MTEWSLNFKGQPFNITVIQLYAPGTNAKEEDVEQFSEALQDLLELTPKKRCPFHHRWLECKNRKSRDTWSTKWTRVKGNKSFAERMHWSKQTPSSNNTREISRYGHQKIVNTKANWYFCCQRWKSSIKSAKTRLEADCRSDNELLIAKFWLKLKKVGKSTKR